MRLRQEGAARRRKVENILIGTKEKDNQDKLFFIIALLALVVNSCSYDLGLESKPLLPTILNLVLMLGLFLLPYLDLCLASQARLWSILWPWAPSVAL